MIYVYNRTKETHEGPNNYPIFRGGSILGNPYTHIKDKTTLASYVVRTRDEAIELYDHYFDVMYSGNSEESKEKLQKRLIKERIKMHKQV